jgi:hypothetical protein
MRYRDWTTRLSNTIKAATERPFSWGEFDCCLFVSDCCVAVCGVDPAEQYRGTYKTERGAKRALVKNHGSLEAAFDACFHRVETALAQRGDLALVEGDDGRMVAVRWADAWWSTAEHGAVRINATPVMCWRVE